MSVTNSLILPDGFIGEAQSNHWFETDLPVFHCVFNTDAYRDELYEMFDVAPPFTSMPVAVIKRRAEFLAGRFCAKKSLELLGIFKVDIPVGTNRNPVWPDNIVGSISHSGTHAVAVSGYRNCTQGVGVDIEALISYETAQRLKSEIINIDEQFFLEDDDVSFIFTLIFSIKESFFKAAYPLLGFYFDFDTVSVLDVNKETRLVKFKLNKTLSSFLQVGTVFTGQYKCISINNLATLVILNERL